MPRFLENSFLALNSVLNKKMYFILLQSIKFKQIYQTWTLKNHLGPENRLLEIGASNLEGPFIYDQTSKAKIMQKNALTMNRLNM